MHLKIWIKGYFLYIKKIGNLGLFSIIFKHKTNLLTVI